MKLFSRNELMVIGGLVAAIIALFIGAVVADTKEAARWTAFAAEHDCRLIEHRRGDIITSTATTFNSNGGTGVTPIITVTPDKHAYLCDDGVTYWR